MKKPKPWERDLEEERKFRDQWEDMFVKILGKREAITTQYHDPQRIAAILEEWAVMLSPRYGYGWWFDKK